MTRGMTGIILCGGRSSRFGSDKALAPWKGGTVIGAVISALSPLFPKILLVTRDLSRYSFLETPVVRLVPDAYTEEHPLGGLHSGLTFSVTPFSFVCACDMPLIRPALVEKLCSLAEGWDAVVPEFGGFPQPLCAVYSRDSAGTIGRMISDGNKRVRDIANAVRTRLVGEDEVRSVDPRGDSFTDIDTPGDLEGARRLS